PAPRRSPSPFPVPAAHASKILGMGVVPSVGGAAMSLEDALAVPRLERVDRAPKHLPKLLGGLCGNHAHILPHSHTSSHPAMYSSIQTRKLVSKGVQPLLDVDGAAVQGGRRNDVEAKDLAVDGTQCLSVAARRLVAKDHVGAALSGGGR